MPLIHPSLLVEFAGTKEVPGFSGYRVTDKGTVFSKRHSNYWKILPWVRSTVYPTVSLYDESSKRHLMPIHKLVLVTFVGPRPEGMMGCHYDGDKSNNSILNLRWDTAKSNVADTARHGRIYRGGPRRKLGIEAAELRRLAQLEAEACQSP